MFNSLDQLKAASTVSLSSYGFGRSLGDASALSVNLLMETSPAKLPMLTTCHRSYRRQ